MRFHEIASGLRLPVSGEEQALINRIGRADMAQKEFDERDQEVARLLCSRGLLRRVRGTAGQPAYRVSRADDIWRTP